MGEERVARALVRCKNWMWIPGMVILWDSPGGIYGQQWFPASALIVDVDASILPELGLLYVGHADFKRGARPQMNDPGTVGCVLALCRNAWNDEGLCFVGRYTKGKMSWYILGSKSHDERFNQLVETVYPSEEMALLACLEASSKERSQPSNQ